VKWKHIVPGCAFCCKCCKKPPNFRHALRKTLMAEMKMKVPKSEDELIEDPFLILGYGINAYFDMMRELSNMFIAITIFFIPVYGWYKGNEAGALERQSFNPFERLQSFTLGNMGGAQTVCGQKKLNAEKLTFECPPGLDVDYDNVIFGIMSPKLDLSYYCSEEAIRLSPDNKDRNKCTYYMNAAFIHKQLVTCKTAFTADPDKQTSCTVKFHESGDAQKDVWIKALAPPSDCSDDSLFYLQAPCKIRTISTSNSPAPADGTKEFPNMAKRKLYGLMVGCLGVFVYLFALIYIDYIKQVQKNKAVDFDVKTITAGDYTVEFDIGHELYVRWK